LWNLRWARKRSTDPGSLYKTSRTDYCGVTEEPERIT